MKNEVARVDAHARAVAALTTEPVEVSFFTAFFDDGLAYAVPGTVPGDADAIDAGVGALFEEFARRGAPVRIELSLLASRNLPAVLAARRLAAVDESPLFICRVGSLRPRREGARVRWVGPGDDPAFVASLMRQGFELRGPSGDAAAALAASLAGPLRLAFAERDGAPAGSGVSTPLGGTTEIASVSTLPNLRRRGVASALTSFLVEDHFASGGDLAWACAPDMRAAALLLDLGFEDAGLRTAFSES